MAGTSPPPISRLLGLVIKAIEPGHAIFEMAADERHHNPMGTLHGGVYCDLADAAMGYACRSRPKRGPVSRREREPAGVAWRGRRCVDGSAIGCFTGRLVRRRCDAHGRISPSTSRSSRRRRCGLAWPSPRGRRRGIRPRTRSRCSSRGRCWSAGCGRR
jgi:uncharacterized protein DUF4442